MNRLLSLTLISAVLVAGFALVAEARQVTKTPSASHHQYSPKPGCGPWKTDGYAGKSGQHTGQPPKQPNRKDCPPRCPTSKAGGSTTKSGATAKGGQHTGRPDHEDCSPRCPTPQAGGSTTKSGATAKGGQHTGGPDHEDCPTKSQH
jgi:hypothetical protein